MATAARSRKLPDAAKVSESSGIVLSVVIACDGALDRLPERLDALARACAGVAVEAIVVHPSGVSVGLPHSLVLPTTLLAAPSSLVPLLWGRGLVAARGRLVAFTTTQFEMREGWGRALLDGFASGRHAGIGGRIALAKGAGHLDRAMFLLRYSEHMGTEASHAPREIAGDNAAYDRQAVLGVAPHVGNGFWEVDVHRLLRASGLTIGRAPGAVADFRSTLSLREMLANRFVHGSHFGVYRVLSLRWPRWRALAVTPLVPAVLLARILARVRRVGDPFPALSLPLMLMLLIAWAAGEARGALGATPRASAP